MSYGFIRTITVDHTQCGSSDSTDFPVLFAPGPIGSLATVANGGHVQNSSGFDIIFTSDSGGTTLLSWEVESYDPVTGTLLAWVKVPTLSASVDTVFYCLYGNASISTFQGGARGAAWDSDFVAVYHFTDDGSGNLLAKDSTANALDGTPSNAPTIGTPISAGVAGSFDANSQQSFDCGNDSKFNILGPITIEAWLKPTASAPTEFSNILSNLAYTSNLNGWALNRHNSIGSVYFQCGNGGTFQTRDSGNGTSPPAFWNYLIGTYDGSTDGHMISRGNNPVDSSGTFGSGAIASNSNGVGIGIFQPGQTGSFLHALVDEIRLSKVVRSADYQISTLNNFGAPGTFSSLGDEVPITGDQSISPSAVPSHRSFGTQVVAGPVIPATVPSHRSFGTVDISGGVKDISPGSVPVHRAFGVPIVAGPILPGTVPSRRGFGTPFINAETTLLPAAVPSNRSFGNPRISFVEQIFPSAVPAHRSVASPTISGANQHLLPATVPANRSFGIPAITGGSGGFFLFVSNKPYAGQVLGLGASDPGTPQSFASASPPTITSQTLGRWTLTIDLYDETGTNIPVFGQSIAVVEGFERRFAGCIQTVLAEPLMGTEQFITGRPTHVVYHVTATDKSGICDRRDVTGKTYTVTDPNTGGPRQISAVILDIVANYLNGEGITTTPQSVPQNGSLGVLAADLTFNFCSVTDAFNQIATLSGCIWTVSPLGVLTFNSYANLPACPFPVTETSHDYFGFSFETSSLNYRNKQYAVSNRTVLPGAGSSGGGSGVGSNTETFTYTVGQPGILSATQPDGSVAPYGIQLTLPVGTLYSLTVNGVTQVIVAYDQWAGQEPTAPPQYGPWFWLNGNSSVVASIFGVTGVTVVVNYTPAATSVAASFGQALTPVDPATGDALAGCGSGLYEAVVQVQNVTSIDGLNAIAQAVLNKSGGIPIKVTFGSNRPGRLPGQMLVVDRPDLNLSNKSMLIIYAQGVYQQADMGFGSAFRWQIQAQTNEDPGNYAQWFATLVSMASNALPVPDYQDATFVLAPGSSLGGGNVNTNAIPVRRTGRFLDMYVLALNPPVNQNLVVTFLVNGQALPLTVTLPASATPNQVYRAVFDPNNPIYVFATDTTNDVITISVAYQVTGANPVPVSNATAVLRWTM